MLPPLHFCQQCLDLPEDLHPSLGGRQLPLQVSNAGITWVSHGSTVGGGKEQRQANEQHLLMAAGAAMGDNHRECQGPRRTPQACRSAR